MRLLWFDLNQADLATELPVLLNADLGALNGHQDCTYLDLSARMAMVEGDQAAARQRVDYLWAKNYREPGFTRFCRRNALCVQ